MVSPRLFVSVILLAVGLSAQNTWTVDDSGGAQFDQLQSAIDFASPGDTLLIQPGFYLAATVDRPLRIIADGPGVEVQGGLTISGIPAPGSVLVSGVESEPSLNCGVTIQSCSALIWIENWQTDATLLTPFSISFASNVVLVNCDVSSLHSAALEIMNSTVHIQRSRFVGGEDGASSSGLAGLSAVNANLFLQEVEAVGGDGGAAVGMVPDGGPGLSLVRSPTFARNLAAQGGAPGLDVTSGTTGSAGVPIAADPPSPVQLSTGPVYTLEVVPVARVGESIDYTIGGPPGDVVALNFAFDPAPFYLPFLNGSILTGVPLFGVSVGTLDSNGMLCLPTVAEPLGPSTTSLTIFAQVIAFSPSSSSISVGEARPVSLFAPGF